MKRHRELAYLMRGLYPEADIEKILAARVSISGVGGSIGAYLADVLTRKGMHQFKISDPEDYEPRNLGRQLCATEDTLGESKSLAVLAHMRRINPEVDVDVFDAISLANIFEFVEGADVCSYQAEGFIPWLATEYACQRMDIPFVNVARKGTTRTTLRLRILNYRGYPNASVENINYRSFGLSKGIETKILDALRTEDLTNPVFQEAEDIHTQFKKRKRYQDLHLEYPAAGDIRDLYPEDFLKRYTDPEMTYTGTALAARAITSIIIGRSIDVQEIDIFPKER